MTIPYQVPMNKLIRVVLGVLEEIADAQKKVFELAWLGAKQYKK